jgi:hypothetical protein
MFWTGVGTAFQGGSGTDGTVGDGSDSLGGIGVCPWVWTHSLMRNMDGDVVCRGAHIFAASLRQATKTFDDAAPGGLAFRF